MAFSMAWQSGRGQEETQSRIDRLRAFRAEFYRCCWLRADALFELVEAVLCGDRPVISLPELTLEGVHRRGHGAMYDALACGRIDFARLRVALAGLELPRRHGQLVVAIDVTPWPRPDAECSADRLHCHRSCRCDGKRKTIPGWPYSVAAALGTGRTSWTAPLDIVRIGPGDDLTELTAAQIRDLLDRLTAAGKLGEQDPPVLVVLDSGYDLVRLSWLLTDVPVRLLGRLRSDRVMYGPAPAKRRDGKPGRPPRHGHKFAFKDPATWTAPDLEVTADHTRYGKVRVRAHERLHPDLERRGAWIDHDGRLPIVEGTIIHITVERLPGNRAPDPVWLWSGHPAHDEPGLDRLWRAYLRRFDLEHTFRFLKQTLGFTRPRLRSGEQADRWAWLIIVVYTQLRLARHLTDDLRRPWETPLEPGKLTPGRVRRGFRRVRPMAGNPASAPKPSRSGPGRPKGRTSTPAPRHPVGKERHKPDSTRRHATQ